MAKILIKKTLDPTSISDIGLWLKADSGVILNGSNVSIWQDQSKNSNNALAKTGGVTVVENSLNGKPVLRFNGSSNLITNSFYVTNFNTPITIIAVSRASASDVFNSQTARYVQAVNDQYDWDFGLTYGNYGTQNRNFSVCHGKSYAGSNDIESSPMGENAIGLSIGINDGSTISSYLNGTLIGTANSSTWNNGGDAVGSFSIGSEVVQNINVEAFFAKCDIAEILIYKKALDSTERQAIENYLNIKYSLGLSISNTLFSTNGNSKLNIKKIIEGSQVSSLSGLSLWLKADAGVTMGGGNVSNWADQSSNGNNAIGPSQKRPTYVSNGLNGKPAMSFNGSTQLFTINDSNSLDITTGSVYVVMQRVGDGAGNDVLLVKNGNTSSSNGAFGLVLFSSATNWVIGINDGNGWQDNFTSFNLSDNNPKIIGFRIDGNKFYAHQNNQISSDLNGRSITNTNGTLQIGGYNASFNTQEYFNGKISEVIIFNRYLSDSEHASIVGYLNNKYSIYPASYLQNGKLRIKAPESLPLNEIFLRLESDKNITLNGSNVSAWGDLSGGTRNFSQATTNNQPIFFNGGLKFEASRLYNDENADYMENTNNPSDINNITGPCTFAVVANFNLGASSFINASSNNSYRRKLSCNYYNFVGTNSLAISNGPNDGYVSSISNPPLNIGQKNIIIIRAVSNTEVDYFINNNAKISQNDANLDLNPGITTSTPLYIGASRGFGGGGYNAEASFGNPVIYDLFLYNKSLTDSEVVALKYYLNNKHAIY